MESNPLLNESMLMDDFAPDIDLLDEILGIDYDWKDLEPTILPEMKPTAAPPEILYQKSLTPILPNPAGAGLNKLFSFAGIPLTGQIYTSGNNTTVILPPQMSIANVLGNDDKIQMKRIYDNDPPMKSRGVRKAPAPPSRRSSHNAIERRYRSSINDKILELKSLVCHNSEASEKVHKAAILKNSIDTIKYLQNHNQRIDKQNRQLKISLTTPRVCHSCGVDQLPMTMSSDLRDLLTANSPPPTSESESSSPPVSPSNSDQMMSPKASPLALFSIAAGLFLINPISDHSHHSPMHSRVQRSIDPVVVASTNYEPKLIAILINLFCFMLIYYISGRMFKNLKKKETSPTIEKFIGIRNCYNFLTLPLIILLKDLKPNEQNDKLAKSYTELGEQYETDNMKRYCGLLSLKYQSLTNEDNFLSAITLIKSKFLLKISLFKQTQFKHPLLTQLGLPFFKSNININNIQNLLQIFKADMISKGIQQLYQGNTSIQYFKETIKTILHQHQHHQLNDYKSQWWATILYAQAERNIRGGRAPVLKRLHKIIDSFWKHQSDEPLSRAVYFAHLAKRILADDGTLSVSRLTDSAAEALRDSINLSTDKPKQAIQLLWALTAEWILEIRLELWESSLKPADMQFTGQFSRDLDTLRSLTHYVPSCLPSVYLYEACLRLMSRASPGRTQQLLDASLRSIRLNQRTGLICTTQEEFKDVSCKIRKNENLIREKRKALALYLRCKHLPSQVITCPGEKAGMLREALKAMENIGDFKKINYCQDMIKLLSNQSLTLQ